MTSSLIDKLRGAYGRGFHDALRAGMNNSRMDELERGLNGVARKVLDATPLGEDWGASQICAEIARKGSKPDVRVVMGCLAALKDQGLIREPKGGRFIRAPRKLVAPAEDPKAAVPDAGTPPVEDESGPADLLSRMAGVAAVLRAAAKSIDDLGIEYEELVQTANGRAAKLKQLQELLRSIGS